MLTKPYSSISDAYDSKAWFATVNNQVTEALRSDLAWVGIPLANTGDSDVGDVRLLDYACGTGLMTRVCIPVPIVKLEVLTTLRCSALTSLVHTVLTYLPTWCHHTTRVPVMPVYLKM